MILVIRDIFLSLIFMLATFFLLLTTANAQVAPVYYGFIEVVDTAGKPLADVQVDSDGSGGTQQTNEKGIVALDSGYYGTTDIKISKSGYATYEEAKLFKSHYQYDYLLHGEIPQYNPRRPIKIELLKLPATAAEGKAFEIEQQNCKFILATIKGDTATVQKLLQAGVNANTKDINGIPAILWATLKVDVEMIKLLLDAGADLHNTDQSGRKVLLYYLYYICHLEGRASKSTPNIELVQRLIKAGADINAADSYGTTVLMLGRQAGNGEIIKLLESAGAR